MYFWPFDVSTVHITYACLGSFVVFFTLFSLVIREKLYLGEAIWATVFGIAIGPYGTNIVNPRSWGDADIAKVNAITMEVTRVVLALGVFAIGVELPKSYLLRHWRSLTILLLGGMTWGWLICGALIYVLVPGLQFYPALVVSACLTPTDPILAAAVCGGKYAEKHVPLHLRRILAAESAANDGLAFPFLYISLYLVLEGPGEAVRDWFLITWLYEVFVGILMGCVFGSLFRMLMKMCEKREFVDRSSSVAQYVALAIMTMGFALLLGVDELLAAFFAGTAFSWDGAFNEATEDTSFSSVMAMLFDSACFIFIGAWMPFASFYDANLTLTVWRLVVITILLLLVRRIPPILMSYKIIPDIKNFKEALFSGHFGPMGVGAVFISSLAVSKLPTPTGPISADDQQTLLAASIQPIVAFVVLWSILIHGLSIPFWTLSKRVNTLTYTWPRSPTAQPEWLNQVLRPGFSRTTTMTQPTTPTPGFVESGIVVEGEGSVDEWPEGRKAETPSQERGPVLIDEVLRTAGQPSAGDGTAGTQGGPGLARQRLVTFSAEEKGRESRVSNIGGGWLAGGPEDEAEDDEHAAKEDTSEEQASPVLEETNHPAIPDTPITLPTVPIPAALRDVANPQNAAHGAQGS